MGNIFSASEVIEIGIQIEKNGRDFYNAVAKVSKSAQAVKIFEYLAGEEEKHIERFKYILGEVKKYEPAEAYPGEYFAYLKALSDGHIFTKEKTGSKIAKTVKTDLHAVEMGIGFEKDSILFYHGIKRVVLEEEEKAIDKLIDEEQNHLVKLTELKAQLSNEDISYGTK